MLTLASFAQFKINYGSVKKAPAKGVLEYGYWYKYEDLDAYIYTFKKNPVGVMKALKMVNEILENNGLDYDKYLTDESLISSSVENMKDYENLDFTIQLGKSNIQRTWKMGSEALSILLNDEIYSIMVIKATK